MVNISVGGKGGCNLKLADCWWRSVVMYCGTIYKRPFLSHLCTDAKPASLTLLHVITLIPTFLSENFEIESESFFQKFLQSI